MYLILMSDLKNTLLLAYKNGDYIHICEHNYNISYKNNINIIKTNWKKFFGPRHYVVIADELCKSLNIK